MNICKLIILLHFSLTINLLNAQRAYYYDEKLDKEYEITSKAEKEIINKFLNENKLKAIEFNPDTNSEYTFRVKNRANDWLLYNSSIAEFLGDYSMQFPDSLISNEVPITQCIHKNKKYFFHLREEKTLKNLWFDQINYYQLTDSLYVWNEEIQSNDVVLDLRYFAAIKRKKKWALVYFDTYHASGQVYQITPFSYQLKEELPIEEVKYFIQKIDLWENSGLGNKFHELSQLLDDGTYEKIEFHPNYKEVGFELRLLSKKGDWHLYSGGETLIYKEGFSMEFPDNNLGRFTIAERKNKKYIYFLGEGGLQDHLWFDEYEPHYYLRYDRYEVLDEDGYIQYDSNDNIVYRIDTVKVYDYLTFQRNDKWAMVYSYPNAQRLYQLSGFHFNSSQAIPDSIFSNYYYDGEFKRKTIGEYKAEIISQYLQENKAIDIATYFGEYSFSNDKTHSILKVRNAETKLWSIQIIGAFRSDTEFPIAVNSIKNHHYGEGEVVLETWCNNKVGYYFYNGDDVYSVFPCIYDDFKYIHLDYTHGCALKQDGNWELYSTESTEKLVKGKAKTIDGLVDLWLNR